MKEGGEIKGREGRKRGKGEKERERREKKKEREKKKQSSTSGIEPATFHSVVNCLWLPRLEHVRTIHVYIANFDFDDLTVAALAALAPPIKTACTLTYD